MKKITVIAAALASVMTSSASDAATRVYTISGGTFSDGTKFGGTFSYDDVSDTYSSANVSVENGALTAFTYTSVFGRNIFSAPSFLMAPSPLTRYLNLSFASSLATASSPVALQTSSAFGTGSYECNNCGTGRFVTAGSVAVAAVPEPATWAMMLVGFAMVGGAARYRRRKVAVAFG